MPAIDYGLAIVMMPLTLLGSLIGAYFYVSFPELILLVILTLLLILLTYNSTNKGVEIYRKETEKIEADRLQKLQEDGKTAEKALNLDIEMKSNPQPSIVVEEGDSPVPEKSQEGTSQQAY